MLGDHERMALHELEHRLALDDPRFVQVFERRQQRMAAASRRRRGSRIAAAVVVAFCVLLLLMGSPAGALAVAGTAVVVWLAWRASSHLDPQSFP